MHRSHTVLSTFNDNLRKVSSILLNHCVGPIDVLSLRNGIATVIRIYLALLRFISFPEYLSLIPLIHGGIIIYHYLPHYWVYVTVLRVAVYVCKAMTCMVRSCTLLISEQLWVQAKYLNIMINDDKYLNIPRHVA